MTANNGWPGKPGWPLNPEKDGWHWVENKFTGDRRAALWLTDLHWGLRVPTHEMAEACIYLGPVLTPEEEAALQKRVAELEGALITAQNMLSEMGISSAEKCQMAYDYLREANAALERGKDEPGKD